MELNWVALPGVLGVFLKTAAAGGAAISAVCWILSAKAKVLSGEKTRIAYGMDDGTFIDLPETLHKQTMWNARAAYCAAGSAACVVVLAILDAAVNGFTV